jgi:hypothetical protein
VQGATVSQMGAASDAVSSEPQHLPPTNILGLAKHAPPDTPPPDAAPAKPIDVTSTDRTREQAR